MHLSENPLSKGQIKLLGSRKSLGRDSPQVKKDITDRLDKSIRYLHNILKDTHNLEKNKIYDKINAQTLNDILENSLKDGYDFRTIELARTLFEISKQYFEQNPISKIHYELREDDKRSLKTISDSYFSLSKSALEKQANEKISIRNEKTMRNDLERLKKSKEDLKYKDEKYTSLEKEKNELQNEVSNLDYALTQKSNSLAELIKQKNNSSSKLLKQKTTKAIKAIEAEINQLKEKQKENHQKTLKIQDKQRKMLKQIIKEENEILKELGKKYDHLKPYFSLKNRLDEFGLSYSPHKPEKEQALGL